MIIMGHECVWETIWEVGERILRGEEDIYNMHINICCLHSIKKPTRQGDKNGKYNGEGELVSDILYSCNYHHKIPSLFMDNSKIKKMAFC
jgi:hypothetical protein